MFEHLSEKMDSFKIESRLQSKSGDYIWFLDRGKVVTYSEDGSPVRMIGTNIDIAKRKQAEEEILKLSSAIEQSIDGIAIADFEPRIY